MYLFLYYLFIYFLFNYLFIDWRLNSPVNRKNWVAPYYTTAARFPPGKVALISRALHLGQEMYLIVYWGRTHAA